MLHLISGISSKWVLALVATLLGGAAVAGTGAVIIVLAASQGGGSPLVLETPATGGMPVVPFVSPIETITPTATLTNTLTPTPTVTVTPTATVTPTITATPTPTVTVTPTATRNITPTVVPTKPGMSGLAFHPAHLNAGGKCSEVYSAKGSLKNHGPALATGVEIAYEVVSGKEWVDHVEVTPAQWDELDTSKPGRFTVYVYTNEDWDSAGKGERIEVRLYIAGEKESTEAVFGVKNQCKEEKPEKLEKPQEPAKPERLPKPEKTPKPTKLPKPAKPPKKKD